MRIGASPLRNRVTKNLSQKELESEVQTAERKLDDLAKERSKLLENRSTIAA
jgi:hypothetical protein